MEYVYIIVGLYHNIDSNEAFPLIGEYSIQSNFNNAKAELKECWKEILEEWKENDLDIIEEKTEEMSFYIENEAGESYTYNIEKRRKY